MSGLFDIRRSPFYCSASATYYLGNFYFQASYQTKNLTVQGNRGVIYEAVILSNACRMEPFGLEYTRQCDEYVSQRLAVLNQQLMTPLYSETQFVNGNNFHRRLNLSVTYTFGYGKKVNRGNEVGEQYGAASAIMK